MDIFKILMFPGEGDKTFSKPIILEWNKYWTEISYEDYECAESCIFTKNKTFEKDATLITFHYPNIILENLPKTINFNRMNVFVSFESPGNYPYPTNLPDNFFNATISYMLNSDYPILYDCFKNLTQNDIDRWSDKEIEEILSKKNKSIVTFVSNCYTSSKREFLIPVLEKYIPITKYGNCYQSLNNCKLYENCEKEELENHFFVLALENSHCTDYFSEKVWRLKNLIVPIIMDRKLLRKELSYLNPYIIALSDFKTVKGFTEYLIYLMNNKEEYKKYFEWTKFYKKSKTCGILPVLPCKICDLALNVKNGYRKEMNARKWWSEGTYEKDYVKTWLKSALIRKYKK
uniref:Fucosyltransferase n=1 Tax=Panagrolaimus davidi TaxID=227884 RepID=A0A914PB12_9BILA